MVVELFLPEDPLSLDYFPVESSNVREVAYNGVDTLFVRFHNAPTQAYEYPMSPSEFSQFLAAPSKGRFLIAIAG